MDLKLIKQQLSSQIHTYNQQEGLLTKSMVSTRQKEAESIKYFTNSVVSTLGTLKTVPNTFNLITGQINELNNRTKDLVFTIKQVDLAIERCNEACNQAKYIADLTESLDIIDLALQDSNVELSSSIISTLNSIPSELLTPEQAESVKVYKKQNLDLLKSHFKVDSDPKKALELFFKSGEVQEGIKAFADRRHMLISEETSKTRHELSNLTPTQLNDTHQAPHIIAFVKYLDLLAKNIKESIHLLANKEQISSFVSSLIQLSDKPLNNILTKYSSYRLISTSVPTANENNLALLDLISSEICVFAAQFHLFWKYASSHSPKLSQITTSTSIQLLLANSVILIQNYLKYFAQKTTDLTDLTTVDDIFYILHRFLNRTISTCHAPTTCSVFNQINGYVKDNLLDVIFKMRTSSAAMNSMERVSGYLQKLVSVVDASIGKQFSGNDLSAIKFGLDSMRENASKIDKKLDSMFDSLVMNMSPQLMKIAKSFEEGRWTMSSLEVLALEAEGRMEEAFSTAYKKDFSNIERGLSNGNLSKLRGKVAVKISKRLEEYTMSKTFTRAGALVLSGIAQYLSEFFDLKEPFYRLMNISEVLLADDPTTIWGKGDFWVLRPDEKSRICSLSSSRINALN